MIHDLRRGFIFIEILIAVALISVVFIVLIGISFRSIGISYSIQNKIKADALARQELEILRSFRDSTTWFTDGLGTVSYNQNYYITFNEETNKYQLNVGTETVDGFSRWIVFGQVTRGFDGTIEESLPPPMGYRNRNIAQAAVVYGYNIIAQVGESPPSPPGDDGGGGDIDGDTVRATVTVSGNGVYQQVVIYLTNWQKN